MTEKGKLELQKKLLIFSVFISISSFLIHEIYSLDVWWQVAIGKDILETFSIPTTDRYTTAALGNLYHDSHWLFQIIIAIFHRLAGMVGVQFFMVAVWTITLYACYRSSRQHIPAGISALLVFLVGLSSIERFLPRPEIITVLMIALFYRQLSNHKYKGGKALAIMALLQTIWTNCHGLFVIGPFMAGAYWFSDIIRHFSGKKTDLTKTSLLLAVLLSATFITPYGLDSWEYAYLLFTEVGGSASHLMRSVGELAPTFAAKSFSKLFFYPFLLLLAATVISILPLVIRKKLSIAKTLIVMALFGAALTGRRNIVLFAIVAAPFIAGNIKTLIPEAKLKSPLITNLMALVIFLVSIYPLSGLYYVRNDIPARSGLGSSPSYYPHKLPEFLDEINFRGNIYNSNIMGGFYLLHSYPERRPLTDGRWEIYDEKVLKSILIAPTQAGLMQQIVSKFDIEGLLLHHGSEEAISLLPYLRNTKKWRLVYYDYAASFWLREDAMGTTKPLELNSETIPPLKPERFEGCHLMDNFLRLMGAEHLRLANLENALNFRLKTVKENALLEEIGKLQLKLKMSKEAEITYQKLSDLEPENISVLTQLAIFAASRGDLSSAENLLYRALKASPDNKAVRENYDKIKAARQSK